jgi:PAS domain S-box-containing protein
MTWKRWLGAAAGMAVAYFLAADLGLRFLIRPEDVAVFWPASGVAAGLLLISGPNYRWPILSGVVLATVVANLMGDRNLASSLAFAVCNAGEAFLIAFLADRWVGQRMLLERVSSVLAFFAATAVSTGIAALAAAIAIRLFLNSAPLIDGWRAWFIADALGVMMVAPLLIALPGSLRNRPSRHEILEGSVALSALAALAVYDFTSPSHSWLTLLPFTVFFPLLLWVAARLPTVFTAAAVFIIGMTLVATITLDLGFGVIGMPNHQRIFAAQAGLLLTALTALILAALFTERRLSEARLVRNNRRLRLALKGAHAGVWEVALHPRSIYWSTEYRKLLGISDLDTPTFENWVSRVRRADLPAILANLRAALQRQLSEWKQEFRIADAQGGERWIEDHARIHLDRHGHPLMIGGISFDITARKQADERLRSSEERYRTALEAGRVGVFDWDVEGGVVRWDERTHAALGLKPGELLDFERAISFAHPDDRGSIRAVAARAVDPAVGDAFVHEWRVCQPDGSVRWVETQGRALFRGEGSDRKAYRLIGTVRGITRRKAAELALFESEGRFRSTFDNAAVGIAHISRDGRWLKVNDVLCRMIGYSQDDMRVLQLRDVVHPKDFFQSQQNLDRLLSGEVGSFVQEVRALRRDGLQIAIRATVSLSRKVDGEPDYLIAIFQDITKEKEAEADLVSSRAMTDAILRSLQPRIAVVGGDGRIVAVNAAWQAVWPDQREWVGTNYLAVCAQAATQGETDAGEALRGIEDVLRGRAQNFSSEYQCDTAIGQRWFSMTVVPLSGHPLGGVVVSHDDITERKEAEHQIRLLLREVNHRAKNLLSVVQVVARQTGGEEDPRRFAQRFSARLEGLAASQDLLVKGEWRGVEICELVRSQLSHLRDLIGSRIDLEGPQLRLSPVAAQTLGMALHELATNAGKYGALSNEVGTVKVGWGITAENGLSRFRIYWQERGGPPVEPPAKKGFGYTVMVRMFEQALNAEVAFECRPPGVTWRISAPADVVLENTLLKESNEGLPQPAM